MLDTTNIVKGLKAHPMKKFWTQWLTNNQHFTKENSDYRRVITVNFSLTILVIATLFYALFNIFYNQDYLFAGLHLASMILSSFSLIYFKKTHNLLVTSIMIEIIFVSLTSALIIIDKNTYFIFLWALLVPPVSYFVLGRRPGSYIALAYFIFFIVSLFIYPPTLSPDYLDVNSLANIIGSFVACGMVVRYYEISRMDTLIELQRSNGELKKLSETDKLTTLYNRLKLDDVLECEIRRAEQTLKPLSIIMIDIDDFKRINDEFGHLVGDSVLMEGAYLMKKNLPPHITIGRWGGEEFLIVCPHTDIVTATVISNNLRDLIDNYLFDGKIRFTISLGVSVWENGDTIETVVRKADHALYLAKEKGKNRVYS
jgi:diguanylate cyclase (GGDEF)-like protein